MHDDAKGRRRRSVVGAGVGLSKKQSQHKENSHFRNDNSRSTIIGIEEMKPDGCRQPDSRTG